MRVESAKKVAPPRKRTMLLFGRGRTEVVESSFWPDMVVEIDFRSRNAIDSRQWEEEGTVRWRRIAVDFGLW